VGNKEKQAKIIKITNSGEFRFSPKLVKSVPSANAFISGSVILIMLSSPNSPNLSVDGRDLLPKFEVLRGGDPMGSALLEVPFEKPLSTPGGTAPLEALLDIFEMEVNPVGCACMEGRPILELIPFCFESSLRSII
jgi:hypothetical protein